MTATLDRPQGRGSWRATKVYSAGLLLPGLAGVWLFAFGRRRRAARGLQVWSLGSLLALSLVFGLTGCGSSSSNDTPKGTYTVPVVVSAASGSSVAAQTVNLSVTVQ